MAAEVAGLERLEDIVPHRSFEKGTRSAARRAAKAMLSQRREALRQLDDELAQLERPLGERLESDD